jgi:site-specific DNA-methyltransferase (adenine-specific)
MAARIDYRCADWCSLVGEFEGQADLVVCDPVYDDPDLSWVEAAASFLRPGGALWAFSDSSGVASLKIELDSLLRFQNWCVWPNDWGGRSRTRFGQKHDDILYYVKGPASLPHTFNADDVSIPKLMTGASLNPSGRQDKIPASVWSDLGGFSTTSRERVRLDGHGVRWQKPEKVVERIVRATSNPGDLVLDPFSGAATVPAVCWKLGRDCVACEIDERVHGAGAERLRALTSETHSDER